MKIPVHSIIDLITNSSTEIFTYSDNSEKAVIEMIDGIFASFGIDKKCNDVFDTVVLADEYDYIYYFNCDLEKDENYQDKNIPDNMTEELVKETYEKVLKGEIKKPAWFDSAEEYPDRWSYLSPSTYLYLIPKKKEYKKLSDLISHFLYSTHHEATYNG